MLIILLELISIYFLCNHIKNKGFKTIYKWIWLIFYIQIIILIIYRHELSLYGREVYWSDAEYYWNATLDLLNGTLESVYNRGYVYYSYLIQKSSPFIWVGFNNISNILVFNITNLIVIILLLEDNIREKTVKLYLVIIVCNPLVIYALLRNLKDILFLFYTILIIYYSSRICLKCSKNKKLLYYIIIVILTILNQSTRPWAFVVTMICLLIILKNSVSFNIKSIILFLIVILLIFIILIKFSLQIKMWLPILLKRTSGLNMFQLLIGPFKILIGPGPIRSILGHKYFMFYTISGNVFCFIGSLIWWTGVAYILSKINIYKRRKSNISSFFSMILLMFLIIYTMAYGGSTELRFRGIAYMFLIVTLITNFEISYTKNINNKRNFILIIISVYVIGILFSL